MFVVDRIEGNYAVVEIGDEFIDVPLNSFREEVKAGDVLYFVVDKEETEKRMSSSKSRLLNLFNRNKNKEPEIDEFVEEIKIEDDDVFDIEIDEE